MRTAIKVINDRIRILGKYLDDTKDDDSPNSRQNRAKSSHAKEMFTELQSTLTKYIDLLRTGVNNEDLAEKISELISTTMVPLVERNKEIISSYKQMMYSLHLKQEEIKQKGEQNLTDADRKTLNDLVTASLDYKNAKYDVGQYLEEYEAALEEIKELMIEGDVRHIFPEEVSGGEVEEESLQKENVSISSDNEVVHDDEAEKLANDQLKQIGINGKQNEEENEEENEEKNEDGNDEFPV